MKTIVALFLCTLASGCMPHHWIKPGRPLMTAEERIALAQLYRQDGNSKAAIREYTAALRQNPKNRSALLGLGDIFVNEKQWKEAERAYRKATNVDPSDAVALNNLSMVYLQRSVRLGRAERLAKKALATEPRLEPYVLDTLVQIYVKQCRVPEATAALHRFETVAMQDGPPFQERIEEAKVALASCER